MAIFDAFKSKIFLQIDNFVADIIHSGAFSGCAMSIFDQKNQQKIRREAAESIQVYEIDSKSPIGLIVDMSAKGMKLKGERPMDINQIYYCRIPLNPGINGHDEVFVDAECRWCKEDGEGNAFRSGYLLRYPSPKDAELIRALIHRWMVRHSEQLNYKRRAVRDDDDGPGFFARVFGALSRKKSLYE